MTAVSLANLHPLIHELKTCEQYFCQALLVSCLTMRKHVMQGVVPLRHPDTHTLTYHDIPC